MKSIACLLAACVVVTSTRVEDHVWVEMMNMQIADAERHVNLPNLPELAGDLGLTTLVKLVKKEGLADYLSGAGPFTVFGPTNDAFSKIPPPVTKNSTVLKNILMYHVAAGKVASKDIANDLLLPTALKSKSIRFNIYKKDEGPVYTAQCAAIDLKRVDEEASNGLLHVLNKVMIPPAGDLVLTATVCPVFQTLARLIKLAKLDAVLKGKGPYTLFAPTHKAFGKLSPSLIDYLHHNKTALAEVLKYHVVSGTQCSAGLSSGKVPTLDDGKEVKVTVDDGKVKVNDASVLYADGSVTNGVLHAIDTVLIPPGIRTLYFQ